MRCQVLQRHSTLTFNHRGLSQFQLLTPVTLPVISHQTLHIHFLNFHWRCLSRTYHLFPVIIPAKIDQFSHRYSHIIRYLSSLSWIHPLIPLDFQSLRPQALHSHLKDQWNSLSPLHFLIYLFWKYLHLWVSYPALYHQIWLFWYQYHFPLKYPVDHPIQDHHPRFWNLWNPQRIHLIKPSMFLHPPPPPQGFYLSAAPIVVPRISPTGPYILTEYVTFVILILIKMILGTIWTH